MSQIGRNDVCHCGSGKKYKKCHLEKDESADRKKREKAALNMAKVAAESEAAGETPENKAAHGNRRETGFMNKIATKVPFFQRFNQRKTGPSSKNG
jgi:hypothetical protein